MIRITKNVEELNDSQQSHNRILRQPQEDHCHTVHPHTHCPEGSEGSNQHHVLNYVPSNADYNRTNKKARPLWN